MRTIEETILELERGALERWGNGDPDAFLELCAEDVSYIDPVRETPIRSHGELTAHYDQVRGKIKLESSEIANARVQAIHDDVAVLTFQFFSRGSEGVMKWNATEVYRKLPEGWRILHTHWSFVQPVLASKA